MLLVTLPRWLWTQELDISGGSRSRRKSSKWLLASVMMMQPRGGTLAAIVVCIS